MMLFFGYIVTDIKYNDLEDDIVKVVNSIDECTMDFPKLIIGWDNAKKYANDNGFEYNILDHEYPNGDMWTFKKTEKREYYEEDIEKFKNKIVEYQSLCVKYYYVNIYSLKYSKFKRLYNIIMDGNIKYFIIDNDMFYLALNDNEVIGISLLHLRYIGISRDKIIDKLKSGKNNKIYYTTSKNMWKLKDWFNGKEYAIASIFRKLSKNKNN